MKRRLWYGICVVMALSVLTACGQKDTEKKVTEEQVAEIKFEDRECLETQLFSVYYPNGWKCDEGSLYNEEDCSMAVFMDGEDQQSSEKVISVWAQKEAVYSFRKDLIANGIPMEDYEEGTTEKMTIGGLEFAVSTGTNSEWFDCMYRYEPSGTSYVITVSGGKEDEAIGELLEGVVLKLQDEGNEDSPWPWDGEPFQPELEEQMIGSYTIVPEYIPFVEPQGVMEIMEHQFVKSGSQVYHLLGDTLTTYEYTDDGLAFVSSEKLEDEYEYMSADNTGMLYLSKGMYEVDGFRDGKKALRSTIEGDLVMHPSGEWGISFWVGSDTQKVTNQGGDLVPEPWILTNLNDDELRQGPFFIIDDVAITDSHIMVAGSTAGEEPDSKIIVYDYDGNQLFEFGDADIGDPDNLGCITGMGETANGFVAADANMRKIHFWAKDGTHVGSIEAEDLFGTDYPWFEDMQFLEDGSLLLLMTQKREDGSAIELMFFRLTGF